MAETRLKRCPVCRAGLTGDEPLSEPCRRCASDLSLVRAAERLAERASAEAESALRKGDRGRALSLARRALRLVDTADGRALLARVRGGGG